MGAMATPVRIRAPRYVIAVNDLERSARYDRDVLGFQVREVGDPGWRFFVRDECFIKSLRDEPWNMREFGIRTIDGHRIMFGSRLNT